jgi:hypothetical protein
MTDNNAEGHANEHLNVKLLIKLLGLGVAGC